MALGIYTYEERALQNLGRTSAGDENICERRVEYSVNRRAASHAQSDPDSYEHFVIRLKLEYSEKCQWSFSSGFLKGNTQGKEESKTTNQQ